MSTRLYIGNLPGDVEEREVEDIFSKHGPLKSCYLKGGRDGSSRFAFVEFEDQRDADQACRDENGREFGGAGRLRVEFARGERDRFGGGGGGGRYDDRGGGYGRYDDRGGGYGRYDDRGGGYGRYEDRGGGYGRYDDRGGGRYDDRGGGRAGLGPSPYGPSRKTEWGVVVSGLEPTMSWQDLKDHFRTFRLEVTYADVRSRLVLCLEHTAKLTTCNNVDRRGNATAMFASKEDMEDALSKVDGSEMKNMRGACVVRVDPDDGGGGGGGGGYRDDRDRDRDGGRRYTPSPERGGGRDRDRYD